MQINAKHIQNAVRYLENDLYQHILCHVWNKQCLYLKSSKTVYELRDQRKE